MLNSARNKGIFLALQLKHTANKYPVLGQNSKHRIPYCWLKSSTNNALAYASFHCQSV